MNYNIEYINSLSTKELYEISRNIYLQLHKDRDILWDYHHKFEWKWIFKEKERKEYYKSKLNFKESIDWDLSKVIDFYSSIKMSLSSVNQEIVVYGIEVLEMNYIRIILIENFIKDWVSNEILDYIIKISNNTISQYDK